MDNNGSYPSWLPDTYASSANGDDEHEDSQENFFNEDEPFSHSGPMLLPDQINSGNPVLPTQQQRHFCAMLSSGPIDDGNPMLPAKRHHCAVLDVPALTQTHALTPFNGMQDILEWLENFETAFMQHHHSTIRDPTQRKQAKGQLLRAYIVEPARSRVLDKLQAYNLAYDDYDYIEATLKTLYLNEASRALGRAELNRLQMNPGESVASYANRLSRAVERAMPVTMKPKELEARKMRNLFNG